MAGEADGRIEVDIVAQTTHTNPDGTRDVGANTISVRGDSRQADVRIGGTTRTTETIRANHRAVLLFLFLADQALRRQKYRETPPRPVPKPASVKKRTRVAAQPKDDDLVPCPKCGGHSDSCVFCDDDRYITARRAREIN